MSKRRSNDGNEVGSVSPSPYEYAAIYEYLGKNRYLQAAFCKSVAKLYSAKFGTYTTKALSNIAAEGEIIGLLGWCKEIGCRWDESVFVSGASGGNVNVIRSLVNDNCPVPRWQVVWIAAAERGHVEALKFAYDSKYLESITCLIQIAAKNGRLNVLKWVHEIEGVSHFTPYTCEQAAMGGFIEIITWLRGVGCDWDGRTCLAAIRNGHVGVLRWALDNGCPWSANDKASNGQTALHDAGNAEVVRFLISRGADVNAVDKYMETPIHSAVRHGKLEVVKAFVKSGADVNRIGVLGKTPLGTAIARGYLEMIEILRAAGAR